MDDFQNSIINLVRNSVNYNVTEFYSKETFPLQAWKKIMSEVFHALEIQDKTTINGRSLCKAMEALGYASEDNGLSFSIGAHLLASVIPVSLYADDNLKTLYLDNLLNGNLVCANAITETEAGSDVFSMKSKAIKNGDEYILSGVKTFCSNIKESGCALVYVITDKEKGVHGGVSLFLLNKEQYALGQTFTKMGLKTCSIGELVMENSVVHKSQLIGKEGSGASIFNTAMDWERIGLSACHVGSMQRLFETTLKYSKTREQGGIAIGKYQSISHKIAEMKTMIHAARLMVNDAADQLGIERNINEKASMCKLFVSETYVKVCEMAMGIHGGNGYMEEYGIERNLRDAFASKIYSGTSEIHKNIIARWNGIK